jgi:hypothetical protein
MLVNQMSYTVMRFAFFATATDASMHYLGVNE